MAEDVKDWATTIGPVIAGLALLIAALTYLKTRRTFGSCALKPETPPNVKRLNGYIQEGQASFANGSYDLAAHYFAQVIDIDPEFLGAHQDLGVVQLKKRDYDKAQHSFEAEINLIDCLRSVPERDLNRFAYLVNKDRADEQVYNAILDRLDRAEDTLAHF